MISLKEHVKQRITSIKEVSIACKHTYVPNADKGLMKMEIDQEKVKDFTCQYVIKIPTIQMNIQFPRTKI